MSRFILTRSAVGATVAAVLVGASFSGGAFADGAPVTAVAAAPVAAVTGGEHPAAVANDRDDQRIRKLHDRLEINASQELLWGQVAQVMRTNDDKMDVLSAARHSHAPTMTAVEDLRSYGEITEAHAAGLRSFMPVFETLYNSMSATQKTNADNVFKHADGKKTKKSI